MASKDFLSSLDNIYPPSRILTEPAQLVTYESDELTAYNSRPLAVVLAETQEEVIETVRDYKSAIREIKDGECVNFFIGRKNAGFLVIKLTK